MRHLTTPHPPTGRSSAAEPSAVRRSRGGSVTVLAVAVLLLTGLVAAPASADSISDTIPIRVERGSNTPAEIALRFSRATFPDDSVDRVVLATEAAFADALASGTLQGADAPLLLTSPGDLRSDVAVEIDRLGADDVTILGGVNALGLDVEEELEDAGLDITRLAGGNRFETAIAVAGQAPEATTAIIARGFSSSGDDTQAFADALAAGAWAAEEGWPVLLTQSDALTEATGERIAASAIERVIILGGEAAIAPQVTADLEALGVDVDRIAGATRFDTAVAVAAERGFDSAADAERVILVEGQADDAWAAGFAAAAHGALVPAPVVLANGDTIPPATQAFLSEGATPRPEGSSTSAFAVDAAAVTDPVLVCAASAAACERARVLLGLPQAAELTLEGILTPVPSRSTLAGVIELHDFPARVAVFGPCVEEGLVVPDEDGAFTLAVQGAPGDCELLFEVAFANGTVQLIDVTFEVVAALPQTGTVIDTETGGDAYTFVADEGDEPGEAPRQAPEDVTYSADDRFVVDGEPATIGAFEASITVADRIVFSADTEDGTLHELTNVDPSTISEGTVGNVDLSAATFAIIEPVSGVVLREGLELTDSSRYVVGATTTTRDIFESAINEGDAITLSDTAFRLTDRVVSGAARDIAVDAVSGIARFRIGGLGDDPLNAEDERFRARADEAAQEFSVEGRSASFAEFAGALTEGDALTYRRTGGTERFTLVNAARPAVGGLVTETSNPDGSPVAPEPDDGGTITLLTRDGRQSVRYSAQSVFRIDGNVATEAEFEAARTPGDDVTYQVADPATDVAEEITLLNRDLTGELTDITEGANSYDVQVLTGVVYEDLIYTAAVFGGVDVYLINGNTVGLAQFENELALIDRGEVLGTVVVRASTQGTEHRLTTEDLN